MASPGLKSPKRKAGKRACVFCEENSRDEDMFGKLLSKGNLTAHYFCMLFASGLSQNGKTEKQGILGFLPSDITKEVRRAARLRCCYCRKPGATIGCVMKNCKKSFHLGCGRRNDTLHQFFDTFCSYCPTHRPQQDVVASKDSGVTCSICMMHVTQAPTVDTLQAPCCKKNWYHRGCIQRYANSAGLYFFKCPLCNNKDDFQQTMLTYGIYIPDQDASWETEPHAFQELLERYRHCDAQVCKCAEGRKYDKDGTKWEIILCEYCGSVGSHVACNHLVRVKKKRDICADCYSVDQKLKVEKKNSVKSPAAKRKSVEMPFLEPALSPDVQKEAGSQYPGPSNKMRKKGLPRPQLTSPEQACPILSPQEKMMSPRMKMTPKSKSVHDGKVKGKRKHVSVASPESKASKTKKVKVRCETQTYKMFKAARSDDSDSSWSSEDELNLADVKKKSKTQGKSPGKKKRKTEIRYSLGSDSDFEISSQKADKGKGGEKLSSPSSIGLKKKYKKKKSIESDRSQTTITKWFKAQPSEPKQQSSSNSSSQTSIIKWFKNRSTALENVGTQPIAEPLPLPAYQQPKPKIKRPKTVEWKGKQLLIKSPRVVLRKHTRLGKLKPRNLTIDMNDWEGDYIPMTDSDVRLTRKRVSLGVHHTVKLKPERPRKEPEMSPAKSAFKEAGASPKKSPTKSKKTDDGSSGVNIRSETVTTESPVKKPRRRGRNSTAFEQIGRDTDSVKGLDDVDEESSSSKDVSDLLYFKKDKVENDKLHNLNDARNNLIDSPAKNLRKRATRRTTIAGVEEFTKIRAQCEPVIAEEKDIEPVTSRQDNENCNEQPREKSSTVLFQLRDMLDKRLGLREETKLGKAETLTPSKFTDKSQLNDGEHTPTSQIHKPFDFSPERVEMLTSGNSESQRLARKSLKLTEGKVKDSKNLSDSPRRSPRVGSNSSEAVCTLSDVKSVSNCSPVPMVKCPSMSNSPRSSPRLKAVPADMVNLRKDTSERTQSPHLAKHRNAVSGKEVTSSRGSDTETADEEADDIIPLQALLSQSEQAKSGRRKVGHSISDILDVNKPCTSPARLKRSVVNKNKEVEDTGVEIKDKTATVTSSPAVKKKSSDMEEAVDAKKSGSFTKLTPRRSPRKLAEAEREQSLSPTACKSLLYGEKLDMPSAEKDDPTQSVAKAYKQFDKLMKAKLSRDKQSSNDKTLRLRSRNSLPGNGAELKDSEPTIVWSLPGTRQLSSGKPVLTGGDKVESVAEKPKVSPRLSDGLFAVPSQENTNPNARQNSLPLKKRAFSKLGANSDIRDFLGKSHSMFFNKPEGLSGLSRSNSECSDISGDSDICTTALKLSPSYVTKFRRSHSRTDVSDISQGVIQNLSSFNETENLTKTGKGREESVGTTRTVSDRLVMTDYYSSKTVSKKRLSLDSELSINSDDSDIMIFSPTLEENVIEII